MHVNESKIGWYYFKKYKFFASVYNCSYQRRKFVEEIKLIFKANKIKICICLVNIFFFFFMNSSEQYL